jgi:ABC-2 type transport system ATP-binding protein
MSLLTLENVSKEFSGLRAVDSVSFSVDRGEVVGFLGPNGAGKSTTMRLITQYLEPDAGEIQLDGVPLAAASLEAKRRIGFLPENNPLYTDMLVGDYLSFIARLRGMAGIEASRRLHDAVGSTGIQDVFYRPIGELSKGFRQRVGLAQAILDRPDLLVLDEPTEGLDPSQRVEIRKLIAELGRERTVMLCTHVLPEVQQSCSRLLIIDRGKIVADGPAQQLAAQASGTVRIAVEAQGEGIADGLSSLDGVDGVAEQRVAEDGRVAVTLTAHAQSDVRPAIFDMAKDRGWVLYELHQETRSLEDFFLELTSVESETNQTGVGEQ